MRLNRFFLVTVLAAVSVFAGSARADLAPPEGYIETCTVENHRSATRECRECSAWHGDREACVATLGAEGYVRACRTSGASAWTEVWCREVAAPAPGGDAGVAPPPSSPPPAADTAAAPAEAGGPPSDRPRSGCGNRVAGVGAGGSLAAAVVGLWFAAAVVRRRRR